MNRRIFWNALSTLAQVIGNAAALFLLYRFLLRTIGVERLGIWSLVLATTSLVTLANQGFSMSLLKSVAKYAARGSVDDVSRLLQTALIAILAGLAAVSVPLYVAARWVLRLVLPPTSLHDALLILPLALASLWITILLGVLQSGLSGHERIAQTNGVEFGGSVAYLLLAFALVPRHGLIGLARAQVIQGGAVLMVTWLLLRRCVPRLPLVPMRFDRALFREVSSYGLQFQIITASQALREPVVKALITRFGGLAMTAYYDMASRLVVNFREGIVQTNQVLIPTISRLRESDPDAIPAVYRESYRLVFFLAFPVFASVTILSPLVSRLWIGRYEPVFVVIVAILVAGWLINVLANPAYVADLGTGALRWVLIGCVTTAVLNAGLGFVAGALAGGIAVAAASAFSLALGYIVVLAAYHLENRVPFGVLLPRESRAILATSIPGALMSALLLRFGVADFSWFSRVAEIAAAALVVLIAVPVWLHPLRRRLLRWVLSRVPA